MKYGLLLTDWLEDNKEHRFEYEFPEGTPKKVMVMALRGIAFMAGFSCYDTETGDIYEVKKP